MMCGIILGLTAPTAFSAVIPIENPLGAGTTFASLLDNILQFLSIIGGVVVVLVVAFAGIRFLTSAGRPEEVSAAKKMVIYAVVGYMVLLLSRALVSFISGILS